MSEEEITFRRLIFLSLLSIQYHPRNVITDDLLVIDRCLRITNLAAFAFSEFHSLE
jgi:hypothetical protein